MIISSSSSYEELLLIIIVIPEKTRNFQTALGLFRVSGSQRACACFLTYFYVHFSYFFYQVQKYSKLLTNGPSTCRDITQNSAFGNSKIAYNCIYIVNLRFLIFRFPQIYNVNAVISDFRVSESAILGDVSAR